MYCANCYKSISPSKASKLMPLIGTDGVKRYFCREECREEYQVS
jgi:hypothetical protein